MIRRPLIRTALVSCALASALLLPASTATAAEFLQGDSVRVDSGETVADDLYVAGDTVSIDGVVDGDVIAFAGTVSIEGTVTGNVLAFASAVRVDGNVEGSLRTGAGQVGVSGTVGKDLLAGAGQVEVTRDGSIGRDLIAGAGMVVTDGDVGRNIMAGAGDLTVAAKVGGDVTAATGRLTIPPGASVNGDLVYDNDTDADVADGTVSGDVSQRDFDPERKRQRRAIDPVALFFLAFLGWLRGLVGMALLALLVALPFPRFTGASAVQIRHRPWPSLGIGAALLFAVPVISAIALGIGIIIGGWWIAIGVGALYAIALVVSVVLAAAFLGEWLLGLAGKRDAHPLPATLLGLLVLWVVLIVPFLGGLVMLAAVLFGLGGGAIALWETARGERGPGSTGEMPAGGPPEEPTEAP